ncbi:transporter substrate-binding domain-containing protein [Ancylobacter sp. MQZ15Z-1]|uniref:Transporter substrate-binding domain-containing protein n=1 Tax=Ancylobacter mangrovi TaxID=2972472 RepID=A0A9X2T0K6_9HYPH|nr:transporter substrate-binding domain-containing protein [Ancylobacter mangrovi]MCS0493717.1 transporter substrate-binding domain-containing protein [Ancylobacter mangrovi]
MNPSASSSRLGLAPPSPDIRDLLAPGGVMRAGINLSNFLLVTDRTPDGDPVGVSPDMARAFADYLGVGLALVPYSSPGLIADAAGSDEWDIALIGAEPQRAEFISFAPAYCEIEATYLVPDGSPFSSVDEVDAAGVRIAVTRRTAYGLWLERNISRAILVQFESGKETLAAFVGEKLDALAGLRPGLLGDAADITGSRVLPGGYTAVRQAIGTPRAKHAALETISHFVEAAKRSGLVEELIDRRGVQGRLTVAPAA